MNHEQLYSNINATCYWVADKRQSEERINETGEHYRYRHITIHDHGRYHVSSAGIKTDQDKTVVQQQYSVS